MILPGSELIHRILHIDNPTISLCIRSVNDIQLEQWHYISSGLACSRLALEPSEIKKILYYQYLFYSNKNKAETFFMTFIHNLSDSKKISLFEGLYQNSMAMDLEVCESAIDILYNTIESKKWFALYQEHHDHVVGHLKYYQASRPELKLLAHAINCSYTVTEIRDLLFSFGSTNLIGLLDDLLEEDVFGEEFYREQVTKIESLRNL